MQFLGWTEWAKNGETAGTEGKSLRIEAVQIKIVKKEMNISYSAHVQYNGWMDWVKNGEIAGTTGESKRVEAIEIKIVPIK